MVCVQSGCPGSPGALLHELQGQPCLAASRTETFVSVLLFLIQQIEQISEHWRLFRTWGSLCRLGHSIFSCVSSSNPANWGNCMDKQKALLVPIGTRGQHGKWSWGGRGLCLSTCWLVGSPESPSNLPNVNKVPTLFGFWGCFFSQSYAAFLELQLFPVLEIFWERMWDPFLWLSAMKVRGQKDIG